MHQLQFSLIFSGGALLEMLRMVMVCRVVAGTTGLENDWEMVGKNRLSRICSGGSASEETSQLPPC